MFIANWTVPALCLLVLMGASWATAQSLSDDEIRKLMIEESINNFEGGCPCPYSRTVTGMACGKHSAYIRPGRASPLCYPENISQKMVDDYRAKHSMTH